MPVPTDVERLRAAGPRVTFLRLAVLAAVRDRPHLGAEAVIRAARNRLGRLSRRAVYGIPPALTRAGPPAAAPGRRTRPLRTGRDGHRHLACRSCGAITDVVRAVGGFCLQPGTASAFTVDEVEIAFWGFCPVCQQEQRSGGDR